MILDATTFFDSGIPTSNDISEQEVSFGIRTIELYIVKPRLGGELYADIVANPANYTNEIEGTSTMAGLETAIEHLTYAYLLWDRTRLTRYTSVIKNDEHSTEPSSKDLWQICNAHYEIGIAFLEEVCEELQAPAPKQIPNGLIFGELMFK